MRHLTASFTTLWAAIIFVFTISACTANGPTAADREFPQTGSDITEIQVAPMQVQSAQGVRGFVSADSVRVRTSPENTDNVAGRLFINDEVEILNSEAIGPDEFVAIKIVKSNSSVDRNVALFIAKRFLNDRPLKVDPVATSVAIPEVKGSVATGQKPPLANRLFIVTNIATERLRIYQRCLPSEGCVNRMIMEAGVVNGEAQDGTHTDAGFYQVSSWTKFYETPPYPAWYKPGYPDLPPPGSRRAWIDSAYMPGGVGDMRGAFGWYTAKVSPNHNGQWTHGTAGWGEDKTDFITFKDSFWGKVVNIFTSVRSHGCTRIDNESIAYIRQLIAVGTPLIKIYAHEGYRDETRARYSKTPGRWEYILTKNGHQVVGTHELADRAGVLARGTPQSEWLDQGVFEIDQYPDAEPGDIYDVGGSAMQGTFLVDEGTLLNYVTPPGITRGGYSDQIAPPYMFTTNPNITELTRRY